MLANQLHANSSAAQYLTAYAITQVLLKAVRVLAVYCVTSHRQMNFAMREYNRIKLCASQGQWWAPRLLVGGLDYTSV